MMTAMALLSHQPEIRRYNLSASTRQRIHERNKEIARATLNLTPQLHEFTIKGEVIMARNRKSALKIYAKRHGKRTKKK